MASKLSRHPAAEINIVPFVDVLLVLVAVLLLLTPFMAKSINVDLPSTTSGAVMTQDTSITIEVHADGTAWLEGSQVNDWDTVSGRMKGATTAKVFADKAAAYQAVMLVLDKLGANDIHNVQFAVKD
jgi:biopolymer transport protein ExbD